MDRAPREFTLRSFLHHMRSADFDTSLSLHDKHFFQKALYDQLIIACFCVSVMNVL